MTGVKTWVRQHKVWTGVILFFALGLISTATSSNKPSSGAHSQQAAHSQPAASPSAPRRQPTPVAQPRLRATGCKQDLTLGDEITSRFVYTNGPKAAKYVEIKIDGADDFTRANLFDDRFGPPQPGLLGGEFVFGPLAPLEKKIIVAIFQANKTGNATITTTIWGTNDPSDGAPPDNAASVSCSTAILS